MMPLKSIIFRPPGTILQPPPGPETRNPAAIQPADPCGNPPVSRRPKHKIIRFASSTPAAAASGVDPPALRGRQTSPGKETR
jgi:hypothetical protein